jgi:hypothetical protein
MHIFMIVCCNFILPPEAQAALLSGIYSLWTDCREDTAFGNVDCLAITRKRVPSGLGLARYQAAFFAAYELNYDMHITTDMLSNDNTPPHEYSWSRWSPICCRRSILDCLPSFVAWLPSQHPDFLHWPLPSMGFYFLFDCISPRPGLTSSISLISLLSRTGG